MYTIIPVKKSMKVAEHDYIFKDCRNFYDFATSVTVPLTGRYNVGVYIKNVGDMNEFITRECEFTALLINLYVPESVVDYISLYNLNLPVKGTISDYTIFKELAKERNLYFEKGVIDILYMSIEHSRENMVEVLDKVKNECSKDGVQITENMLAPHFILSKTTFPRTVLIDYIQMTRWRKSKMIKCLEEVGNDIMLYAMIKNLKKFAEDKINYYKTGKASKFTKSLNTTNLEIAYRVFIVERNGIKDVPLLLSLYERGLSPNDIIQR